MTPPFPPAPARVRLKAAWFCLLGRSVVFGCHLPEGIAINDHGRRGYIAANHLGPVLPDERNL